MALENKKVMTAAGVQHLWSKIIEKVINVKVSSVGATANKGIEIGGTNLNPTVGIKLDPANDNALSLSANGLYYQTPAAADTYILTQVTDANYAASYKLQKLTNGTGTPADVANSATINIAKDMVVQSGSVGTVTVANSPYSGAAVGDSYIELVLANATNDHIYIPANGLVEYVTSGSSAGDMIVIGIDSNHQVTATITDGTITKAKLVSAVQSSLNKADSALQESDISTGTANGKITVGTKEVSVYGLGSAAYENSTAFDAAGAAAAVLGTASDTKTAATVYGAKAYADDVAGEVYAAIIALTDNEIDTAIAAAEAAAAAAANS